MHRPDGVPTAIHETVLYAQDLVAATAFYVEVVGLRVVAARDSVFSALRVTPGSVLLLFDPAAAAVEGREVPSHGALGPGHVAFTMDDAALAAVRARCAAAGVDVERELTWPRGGHSVYVRDPAGNSVEFVVGEIWPD